MPQYEITVPGKGTFRVDSPVPLSDAQAYAAIQQQLAAAPPETTVGGQVKEFFKGLVPGAIGLAETAGVGAAAILPEAAEKAVREKIQGAATAARAPFEAAPGYEQSVGRKFGEAFGSTAPFLAMGPLGLAGRVGLTGMAGAAGAGEARLRAEQAGATEDQRAAATAAGVLPGLAEVFAPMRIMGRIPDAAKAQGVAMVKRAFMAGGEEAAQEAATNFAQNLIAKGIYKPEQELIEGLGESAAYGGATGALMQGVMDLALGRRARSAQRAQEDVAAQEEAAKQRKAEAEAEAARRAAPEYLPDLAKRYQDAQEQFKQQQEQIKALKKAGDPASKMQAQEAQEALKAYYRETILPLSKEINEAGGIDKIKQLLAEQAEAARVAGMTPEEYMMEGLGMKPAAPTAAPASIEEAALGAAQGEGVKEPSELDTYAEGQIQAARQVGALDAATIADYLMEDEAKARALVQEQTQLPGMSAKESRALLGGLKLRLAEIDKQKAAEERQRLEAEQAKRAETMAAVGAGTPAMQPDLFAEAIDERAAAEAEPRPAPTSPEYEREAEMTYPEGIAEKAFVRPTDAVEPAPVFKPMPPRDAARILQQIDSLGNTVNGAAARADTSFRSGNKEAGVQAMREREVAQANLNTLEQQGGAPGALLALRKAQDSAIMDIAQLADDLKAGRTLGGPEQGTASSTPKTLINQINKKRDALVTAMVQEAAAIRRMFGKALTKEEAAAATAEINKVVDEWVTRSMAQPITNATWVDRLVAQANARAAESGASAWRQPWLADARTAYKKQKLQEALIKRLGRQRMQEILQGTAELKGAETELPPDTRRVVESSADREFFVLVKQAQDKAAQALVDPRPLEERQFGAYRAASQVLQEQLKQISSRLSEVPETGERVTSDLKIQFPETEAAKVAEAKGETATTRRGELVRAREYTIDQIDKALTARQAPGVVREALTRARAALEEGLGTQDVVSEIQGQRFAPGLIDAANELAQRVISGQTGTKTQDYDGRLVRQIVTALRTQPEVAPGQKSLFPEADEDLGYIRTTPKRFEQAPEVRKRREGILDKGEELTAEIRAELDRIDAENEAILAAQDRVAERSDALQSAWQSAVKKARQQVIAVRQAAKNKELAALKAQLNEITKYGIFALDKENTARATELYKQIASFDVRAEQAVDAAEFLPKAMANKWVEFERKALAEAQAELAKYKTPETAKEAERRQAALAQAQRAAGMDEAAIRREAQVTAQQRAREGLGLAGVRRVDGKLVPIQAESKEARAAREAEARERAREEAREAAIEREQERMAEEAKVEDAKRRIEEGKAAFKRARSQESKTRIGQEIAQATKDLQIAQARIEAIQEGRPRRTGPATVISGTAIAANKPLRTGSEEQKAEATKPAVKAKKQKLKFSQGAAADAGTSATLRKELNAEFGKTDRVEVFDTVDALVEANPEYEGRIPSDTRGFVDPESGRIFMVAENINKGEGVAVLLHEVGAHVGMKEALPGAQYDALVKAVSAWAARNDGSTESKVAKAALARVQAAKTSADQRGDELLAYTIEEARKAGVTLSSKGPLGQWLTRVANAFRKALEKFGLPPKELTVQQLVDMAYGAADVALAGKPTTKQSGAPLLFSRAVQYNESFADVGSILDKAIAKDRSAISRLKENFAGMGFRTQWIDKLDPLQKIADTSMEALKATQMMYYLRMYEQRNHFTSQAISNGVPELVEKTRRDGRKEWIIESQTGAKIKDVVDILSRKDVVKAVGSPDAANRLFTAYLAAKRAKRVGLDALDFGGNITQAELDMVEQKVEADEVLSEAFKDARNTYNAYNRNLLKFAVQTGSISKDEAAKLLASDDYVPYYRQRDGVAELVIGGETPIRIGNLKDNQHLQALKGGDKPILDFLTSSVQNTSMLLDMSMRNLAAKNAMLELGSIRMENKPLARVHKGDGPEGAVRFKIDGEKYHAIVNTDAIGIPSELLIKGMQGIPTQLSGMFRLMAAPAQLLRRAIVANPLYAARQLFRDSLSAAITSGADMTPVLGALKQIGKKSVLDARGVTGGQVFTGMPEDMSRLLAEMQKGRGAWATALAKLETISMEADAATRRAQYNSYIEQGLSEMEATFMSLESMNFSRRGVSPTVQTVNAIIPFVNAQIQGLDMLYRAFTGKLPMNERLQIREKLYARGLMLAGASMVYALLMQDDEAYKNATPEQKYGNWFVRVPGVEEPVRVPIPFEIGYIFKALPEALVNTVMREDGAEEARKAFLHIAQQTVPGGSSYGMPAAVKPLVELTLGKSFFTGRDIESAQEQAVEPRERYRAQTSELAKAAGDSFNLSPIKLEYLINGYTGSMGMALLQTLSAPIPTTGPEGAYRKLSETPLLGTLFQPNDAGGIINMAYERVKEAQEVQATFKRLAERDPAKAERYAEENVEKLAMASAAGRFRQIMGRITQTENAIKNSPDMSREEKTQALKELRQVKIELSREFKGEFA
jgi:hypothetical protein